jgi:hypothetical protein
MPGWHSFDKPANLIQDKPPSRDSSRTSFTSPTQYNAQNAFAHSETTIFIALKSNEVFGVWGYLIDRGRLNFVLSNGTPGSAEVDEVDWKKTSEINTSVAEAGTSKLRAY